MNLRNFNPQAAARTDRWWKPKASSLLNIIYLVMFMSSLHFSRSLLLFTASLVTILGIGSFGHFLNDWFDIEADEKAGKRNRFGELSDWQRMSIIFIALFIALLPWTILPLNFASAILLGLEFALLLAYAIPPLRFKERIYFAIPADAAYAYSVPSVLAAHTFFLASGRIYDPIFLLSVFAWQFSLGVRHFLNHLALDRLNDLACNTQTLATTKGNYYLHRMISSVILPSEVVFVAIFLLNFSRYSVSLVAVCIAAFLVFSSFPLVLTLGRTYSVFSYRFSTTLLDNFYQNILPFITLFFLMLVDLRFISLLIAHVFLFHRRRLIATLVHYLPTNWLGYAALPPKIVFGYPLLLLNRPDSWNNFHSPGLFKTETQVADVPNSPRSNRESSRANIAVVNANKSKYTETFINELVPRLNYNVYYLHGGDLPTHDHQDRHFLSKRPSLHALAGLLQTSFKLDGNYFVENSIASYLQARRIRLVLAEFGPVGTRMLPITRDLGIPLIVYFHGYDVFHQPTWTAYLPSYKQLFKEAEKIIVVSKLMRQRFGENGAPLEKVIHLPAFVDLELFPVRDRSSLPPRFIAVGRFAETKSPHLTILAFKKVVEAIPQATLVMVGKGGGGELFEACLILTKALGLERSVIFKGVVSHNEVAEEMTKARVFVQHSVTTPENHDMEGKPVAIMEAMASGLPVIATRHSGIVELITDEQTGLLVEEYDVDAMAEAMIRLATDDSSVKSLGENASDRIRNDPLIRDHVAILEGIIQDCINHQHDGQPYRRMASI